MSDSLEASLRAVVWREYHAAPVAARTAFRRDLGADEIGGMLRTAEEVTGSPWALYDDDPDGFITEVLGIEPAVADGVCGAFGGDLTARVERDAAGVTRVVVDGYTIERPPA